MLITQPERGVVFKNNINKNTVGIESSNKKHNGYKFELGAVALKSGEYKLLIKINNGNDGLNKFNPVLIIRGDPKVTC